MDLLDDPNGQVIDGHTSARPLSVRDFYTSDPAYAASRQKWRSGGTFGITMMDVQQDAAEVIDPAIPELVIFRTSSNGSGETDYGDGWKPFSAGALIEIQPANTDCQLRLPKLSLRGVVVPDAAFSNLLQEIDCRPSDIESLMQLFHWLPEVSKLIDLMWHASETPSPATNLILDGALMQLTGHLLTTAGKGARLKPVAAMGDVRLSRAIDYLETHLAEPITVGELAGVAAMSTSAFARSFRVATGRTVWSYVIGRRTERAHEMILYTDLPLAQIAADCGFSDPAHLSRTFRATYGTSPSALR